MLPVHTNDCNYHNDLPLFVHARARKGRVKDLSNAERFLMRAYHVRPALVSTIAEAAGLGGCCDR
ncbi:MAG: hypothetical protein H6908_00660 [Hyphomicrobiales bacterium]|nr:hypothetical protein [Hyphomicrobiales bacterium]